jgi:hypothetical protein
MIHALQYEPQGQRQHFEPEAQHRAERGEQDRHIHLHVHLNLTLRASQGRSTSPNAMRIARICAALVAATVMPLGVFIFAFGIHDGLPDPLLSLGNLPFVLLFAGLALAWGFGCLPLLVSTWRASPHGRFRLFGPLVLGLGSSLFFLLALGFGAIPPRLMELLVMPLLFPLFFVQPLITALLLRWVSREARALSPIASAHRRLSFVVVSGMVFALLGELLWYLSAMLGGGMLTVVVPPVMFAAVIVAICTFLESRKSSQAHPKDASPSDVDSPGEPLGYRG